MWFDICVDLNLIVVLLNRLNEKFQWKRISSDLILHVGKSGKKGKKHAKIIFPPQIKQKTVYKQQTNSNIILSFEMKFVYL